MQIKLLDMGSMNAISLVLFRASLVWLLGAPAPPLLCTCVTVAAWEPEPEKPGITTRPAPLRQEREKEPSQT